MALRQWGSDLPRGSEYRSDGRESGPEQEDDIRGLDHYAGMAVLDRDEALAHVPDDIPLLAVDLNVVGTDHRFCLTTAFTCRAGCKELRS